MDMETFEDLRKEIEQLRSKQPTLNSHEIWEHLVKNSDRQKPLEEITVETCLVAYFDYPEEETVKIKARNGDLDYLERNNKALMELLKTKLASTKPILPVTKNTQSESEDTQSEPEDTEKEIQLGAEYKELNSLHTALDIDRWVSARGNLALQLLRDINPGRSYEDIDHKLLFRCIREITLGNPKLSSRQIWRRLNQESDSENSWEEVVVEAWLLVAFDYPIEKTVQIKAHDLQVRQSERDRLDKEISFNNFTKSKSLFIVNMV